MEKVETTDVWEKVSVVKAVSVVNDTTVAVERDTEVCDEVLAPVD